MDAVGEFETQLLASLTLPATERMEVGKSSCVIQAMGKGRVKRGLQVALK